MEINYKLTWRLDFPFLREGPSIYIILLLRICHDFKEVFSLGMSEFLFLLLFFFAENEFFFQKTI